MSKFLLNLLVQLCKVLPNSKFLLKFKKNHIPCFCPPPPTLAPIKDKVPCHHPPHPPPLSSSSIRARAPPPMSSFPVVIARSPRRRLSPDEVRNESLASPSPFSTPAGEPLCPRAAGGQAPVSTPPRPGGPIQKEFRHFHIFGKIANKSLDFCILTHGPKICSQTPGI
jgi:hypothetical protein